MESKPLSSASTSASALPVFFTFSRLGASDSSIYQCETSWFRDAHGSSDRIPDPRVDDRYGYIGTPDSKICWDHQNQLMSTATPSRCSHCSIPHAARFVDKPSTWTVRPLQHTLTNIRSQNAQASAYRLAYELPPPLASSTESELTACYVSHTRGKLLPPINLTSQVHTPIATAPKSLAARFPNGYSPTAVGLRDEHDAPPWGFEDIPAPSNGIALGPVSSDIERRLACTDIACGERSLHKVSGSRELRRQAGWAAVGTCGPDGTDEPTHSYSDTSSSNPEEARCEHPITPPRKPRLWIGASSSEESVKEAVLAPMIFARDVWLTLFQQLTTGTSPSKPRLITISPSSKTKPLQPTTPLECRPALVSAFSPDTPPSPPETPDVANRIDVDEDPTCPTVERHGRGSSNSKIYYPITPPDSRVPTPFDKLTSSSCFRKRPRWGQPTMTQLDPATAWILQELEVLLADFPMTALRLNSPVVQRIRSATSAPPVPAKNPDRHRSFTAPHSRYSPYRPVMNFSASAPSPRQDHASSQPSRSSRSTHPDPTAFALRTVFPSARPHHLDSLHASFLALHYVVDFPSSEFSAASASEPAASPYTMTSTRHSRSSSMVSNVPPKARAMLGLESPVETSPSLPSPTKSWFRASTPELDPELRMRLENVGLLLEASVRKILVEIEGRSFGKQDDALVRAVGEVIKMGEGKSRARTT